MTMFEILIIPGLLALACLVGLIAYRPEILAGRYRPLVLGLFLIGGGFYATVMLYGTP